MSDAPENQKADKAPTNEVSEVSETPDPMKNILCAVLGNKFVWNQAETGDNFISIPAEHWKEVCFILRDNPELDLKFFRSLSGTHFPEDNCIEVTGHLFSYIKKHTLTVKTRTSVISPELDTLSDIWPAANWYEREIYDLLGINFSGHPDMRRILLPDDWEGHPLLKDYVEKEKYRGIPTTRPGYEKTRGEV